MRIHRVAVALITLIVIQFAFFAAVIVEERRQRWVKASKMTSKMANISRSNTEDFFNRYLSIFDALTSVDAFILQEPKASNMILHRLNNKYTEVVNFAAVKKDGGFFASGKPMLKGKIPNVKHLEFVQRIFSGEKHVIMQPHPGPISKEMVTGIAVPLKNQNGHTNGVIGVSINYQAIVKRWDNLFLDTEIMIAVSDEKRKIIHISSGLNLQNNNFFNDKPFGRTQKVKIEKKTFVVHTVQHLTSGWNFSIFVPAQDNLIYLVASRKDLIFLFGLMIITIFTLGIWFNQERQWTTKLKSEQEQLRQSEEDLKASQRIAHLGSWRLDLATNQVIWTEELYKMYGFDPTIPPPPYTEQIKIFTSESWEKLSTSLARTIANGIPYELELETVREDGSNGWIWVRGEVVKDSEGDTIGLWGVAQDILDRKRDQEKLSLQSEIITRMSEGVSLADENGIIVYTNPGFEKMLGYDSGEMIGLHISIVNAPTKKHPEKIAEEILNILNNKGVWSGEIQNIKKDGTSFWSSANVTAIEHLKYGKAFVSVQADISELIQAKNEKKKLEAKLQQAQKMESIGNLAGGIAHDFNNLLYPIIGFAEMLKDDLPPDSPEHESAQEIFNAGKRGGELVKQILAFSRQSDHKLQPVRVQKILNEVLKLTRSSIPTDIEIDQDIQQDCGAVMAEATQLHQIAMNLITNAYHAVERASGKISVQLKEIMLNTGDLEKSLLQSGKYAMLTVSDSGIGISRNVINNIFEPYFTTKEQGKGTGLGLAVVYGIVKEHFGDIKVSSEEGKGTTFNVYIPLMKKPTGTEANDPVSVLPTGTESLLLVDDEKSVIRLEKQILERLGYNVVAQSSSIKALEIFKSNPNKYDLVITDMTMPGMTGDKLAKEILSIKLDMPVIICTGFSERINKEQAETMGVNGFLMKPVVKSEMANMVRKVLDEAKIS